MSTPTPEKQIVVEVTDFSAAYGVAHEEGERLVIDALHEALWVSPETIAVLFKELASHKRGSYTHAGCAVYPPKRFFYRYSIPSTARLKNNGYLEQLLGNELQVQLSESQVGILDPLTGTEFNDPKNLPKEVLFCGAPALELAQAQARLLEHKIYPDWMSLGTLATLGALADYAHFSHYSKPTGLIEISPTATHLVVLESTGVTFTRKIDLGLESLTPVLQKKLNLSNPELVSKLLFAKTFDFSEIGPDLLKDLGKEIESVTGFYEAHTGQAIGQIYFSLLPESLSWVGEILAKRLSVETVRPNYGPWLKTKNIQFGTAIDPSSLEAKWLSVIALMDTFNAPSAPKPS